MNETVLTVLLELKDQLSGGVSKAESELSGLASGGISTAGRALNSLESAAGHAKATLGGLAGSMLGQLGIGYGLMKISGFLEDAIGNLQYRNVEGSSTKVEDQHGLLLATLVETVRECSGGGLVHNT